MSDESNSVAGESITDDDISLNSSGSEEEEEYTVEEILAERLFDDSEVRYLVKWEGYPEERCDISIFLSYVPVSRHCVFLLTPSCQDVHGSLLNHFLTLKALKTG